MQIITKNGWYAPGCHLIHRLEPWTQPQEIEDDLFDIMPSKMIIIVPPAGYRFRDGITAEDFPIKVDVVPLEEGEDAPKSEGKVDAKVIPHTSERTDAVGDRASILDRLKDASDGKMDGMKDGELI